MRCNLIPFRFCPFPRPSPKSGDRKRKFITALANSIVTI